MKPIRYFFHCMSLIDRIALLFIALLILSACTTYEPVPAYTPVPSGFDRSWSAATAAARDAGVRVDSEDLSQRVITGTRDGRDMTIAVSTQADGRVRVEISARCRWQRLNFGQRNVSRL